MFAVSRSEPRGYSHTFAGFSITRHRRYRKVAPRPAHRYSWWFLGLLCIAYVSSILTVFVDSALNPIYSIAMYVYLAVLVAILIIDWQGFLTLHGHADWRALSWPACIGLAFVNLLFWSSIFCVLALYLGLRYQRHVRRLALPSATAEAEDG